MMTGISHAELRVPPPEQQDLFDGDRRVGWIAGDRIGFAGFATTLEAAHAAQVVHTAIDRWAARRMGRPAASPGRPRLELVEDASGRWIEADGAVIARLVIPRPDEPHWSAFGIELRIPIRVGTVAARSAAYVAYRALRRSGPRWSPSLGTTFASHATAPAPINAAFDEEA